MATATASVGHFQPRANILRRSKGDSAAGKAAYNARARIENERTGKVYDFTHLPNQVLSEHFYPAHNSPEWAKTRGGYWNGVERRENRTDSQLAMDWVIDLPHQLQENVEHARFALQDFIRENFTKKGYSADLAFHPAHDHGDARNFHAHLMVGIRRFEADGSWSKVKDGVPNEKELADLRERMAKTLNNHLKRQGYDIRVDHRSLEDRGIDREATIHLGKHAAALERRGIETEPGNINREIEERNEARQAAQERARQLIQDMTPAEVETTLDRLRREDEEQRQRGTQPSGELFRAVRRLFVTMGQELGNVINIDPAQLNRQGATYRRDIDEEQRRAVTQAAQDAETKRTLESIERAEQAERQHKAAEIEAQAIEERRQVQERLAEFRAGLEEALEREGYKREELGQDYTEDGPTTKEGREAQEMAARREREEREQAEIEERRQVQERLAEFRSGLDEQLAKERDEIHADRGDETIRTPTAEDWERLNARRREMEDRQVAPEGREANQDVVRDRAAGGTTSSDRAHTWMSQAGGYEQLSEQLKAAARKSYEKWATAKPDKAKNLPLEAYVSYTQEQDKKRQQQREELQKGTQRTQQVEREQADEHKRELERTLRKKRRRRPDEDEFGV